MWGMSAFGLPVHDTWWQTETGAIMIANFVAEPVSPGSMGRPLPGIEAGIARRNSDGSVDLLADGETGEIVLRPGWPSMFTTYLGNRQRYTRSPSGTGGTSPAIRHGATRTAVLVCRTQRRHHQVVRSSDQSLRSGVCRQSACGGDAVGGDRLAGPRHGSSRARSRRAQTRSHSGCWLAPGHPGARHAGCWAPPLRREKSSSRRNCRERAAARSCVACCALEHSACQKATCRRSKRRKHRAEARSMDSASRPSREHGLQLLRQMLRIRCFEDRCAELYSAGKIRGFLHLYNGEEAVAVGVHAGPDRR